MSRRVWRDVAVAVALILPRGNEAAVGESSDLDKRGITIESKRAADFSVIGGEDLGFRDTKGKSLLPRRDESSPAQLLDLHLPHKAGERGDLECCARSRPCSIKSLSRDDRGRPATGRKDRSRPRHNIAAGFKGGN